MGEMETKKFILILSLEIRIVSGTSEEYSNLK